MFYCVVSAFGVLYMLVWGAVFVLMCLECYLCVYRVGGGFVCFVVV